MAKQNPSINGRRLPNRDRQLSLAWPIIGQKRKPNNGPQPISHVIDDSDIPAFSNIGGIKVNADAVQNSKPHTNDVIITRRKIPS